MSLKIEDIKPGDIFLYDKGWYFMVIQQPHTQDFDCIWVAENKLPRNLVSSSWKIFSKDYDEYLKLPKILEKSEKITNLSAEILIEELKKIDNRA